MRQIANDKLQNKKIAQKYREKDWKKFLVISLRNCLMTERNEVVKMGWFILRYFAAEVLGQQ